MHLNPVRAVLSTLRAGLERYRWSSLAEFMRSPGQRAKWLQSTRVFGTCGLKDSVHGRKRYLKRLERRVALEGVDSAGLVDGESIPGLSLQSTLRRGWYFGSETFKERMLGLLEVEGSAAKKKADGYTGEQMRDHGTAFAQRLLDGGCEALGMDPDALRLRKANDEGKVVLAELIASQTSVPLDWLCENLGLGSRSHGSRLINAQRRKLHMDSAMQRKRDCLLKRAIYNDSLFVRGTRTELYP